MIPTGAALDGRPNPSLEAPSSRNAYVRELRGLFRRLCSRELGSTGQESCMTSLDAPPPSGGGNTVAPESPPTTATNGNGNGHRGAAAASGSASAAASREWRTAWRIHFYSGVFALPFVALMALTGLVILYTQPIQDWTEGGLRTVEVGDETVPYEGQVAAVEDAYPDATVLSVTTPSAPDRATVVGLEGGDQHTAGNEAFVDPYTGEVLGSSDSGGVIVGLANRLHGFLNLESVTMSLPTVSALWDGEAVMREYVVFDLVLELLGVWTLVLVFSGLFLWWPRRTRSKARGTAKGSGTVLGVRRGVTGRARLRDLHGMSGLLVISLVVVTVVSGLGWSTYWGANFGALADELTPGEVVEAPPSGLGTRGDLDRFGNQLTWNTGDFPIPASYATSTDGSAPAPVRLDDVVRIARDEGMEPGFSVYLPTNVTAEDGETTYGSFTVSNSWPRKTGEARDLYLDQFTGETLDEQRAYGLGPVGYGMDVLVSTHMGTQLGLVSRVMMTLLCVLALFSVGSALAMFRKRRRPGTVGLPRRPADVRLPRKLAAVGVAAGVVFPQWGVSALAVLAVDRFVLRRVPRLRAAFGQR
jgi:uncharacterized iron-regulated membrane protein